LRLLLLEISYDKLIPASLISKTKIVHLLRWGPAVRRLWSTD